MKIIYLSMLCFFITQNYELISYNSAKVELNNYEECTNQNNLDGLVLTKIITHLKFSEIGLSWNEDHPTTSEQDILKAQVRKQKSLNAISSQSEFEQQFESLNAYWESNGVKYLDDAELCSTIKSNIKSSVSDIENYEFRAIYLFEKHYLVALKSNSAKMGISPVFILDDSLTIVRRFGI